MEFKDTLHPIVRCLVVVLFRVVNVVHGRLDLLMSEPVFDGYDVEGVGGYFLFDESGDCAPVSHVVGLEIFPDLFAVPAEFMSKMSNGEWSSIGLEIECVFAVLVCDFGSPVVNPVLEALVCFGEQELFSREECSLRSVFLDFGDHNATSAVIVDDHILGGQLADFTRDTPADEEAVAEEILVEGVFVVILRVSIVEKLVDNVGKREDPSVCFGRAWWFVRP